MFDALNVYFFFKCTRKQVVIAVLLQSALLVEMSVTSCTGAK